MPDAQKIKAALFDASKDYSHRFDDVVHYLQSAGWKMRLKGSHHIFTRPRRTRSFEPSARKKRQG
jgi:hypothetical protein